jgi:hypothetical protein
MGAGDPPSAGVPSQTEMLVCERLAAVIPVAPMPAPVTRSSCTTGAGREGFLTGSGSELDTTTALTAAMPAKAATPVTAPTKGQSIVHPG